MSVVPRRLRSAAVPLVVIGLGALITTGAIISVLAGSLGLGLILIAFNLQMFFTAMLIIQHRATQRVVRRISRTEDKLMRRVSLMGRRARSESRASHDRIERLLSDRESVPVEDSETEGVGLGQPHRDVSPEVEQILFDLLATASPSSKEHLQQ